MDKRWNPLSDMPALAGRKIVITGGTGGIGLHMVRFLALGGATIYMAARSEKKVNETIETITKLHPSIQPGQISSIVLDLGDLGSVSSAVETLKSKETSIDVLINNAAICTASTKTLGDNWEPHMAVNYVGHFAFTNGLLPLLKNATHKDDADVRIITLCSKSMNTTLPRNYPFQFASPTCLQNHAPHYPWSGRVIGAVFLVVDMVRYATSKIANLLFAQELQRLLDEQGLPILSIAVHPGNVGTDTVYGIGTALFRMMIPYTSIPVEDGAITPLFAATAKEVRANADLYKGKYLEPFGRIVAPHKISEDRAQVQALWKNTTTAVNAHLKTRNLPSLLGW